MNKMRVLSLAAGVGLLLSSEVNAAEKFGGNYFGGPTTAYAMWRPSSGTWLIQSASGQNASQQFGQAGDFPVVGDFDGDNVSDYAVWRPANGMWYWLSSQTGTMSQYQWGIANLGDLPVPADYDGDGKTDIAVWRQSTGVWYVVFSSNAQVWQTQWGDPQDFPVAGDYDGDGKSDVAVWRPSNGTWYIIPTNGAPALSFQWGAPGDIPVPCHLDSDNRKDLVVYREGVWYYATWAGRQGQVAFGGKDDIPFVMSRDSSGYIGDVATNFAVYSPSTKQISVRSNLTLSNTTYNSTLPTGAGDVPVLKTYPGWETAFILADAEDTQDTGVSFWKVEASIASSHVRFTGTDWAGAVVGTLDVDGENNFDRTRPITITTTKDGVQTQLRITSFSSAIEVDQGYDVTLSGVMAGQPVTIHYRSDGTAVQYQSIAANGDPRTSGRKLARASGKSKRLDGRRSYKLAMSMPSLVPLFPLSQLAFSWGSLASAAKATVKWGGKAAAWLGKEVKDDSTKVFLKGVALLGGSSCGSCALQLVLLGVEFNACSAAIGAAAGSDGLGTPLAWVACGSAAIGAQSFYTNCKNTVSSLCGAF